MNQQIELFVETYRALANLQWNGWDSEDLDLYFDEFFQFPVSKMKTPEDYIIVIDAIDFFFENNDCFPEATVLQAINRQLKCLNIELVRGRVGFE